MIKSMTGFGRGDGEGWTVEIRTVNHRYGDIAFRMPHILSSLENRFKEVIRKMIKRGRIEVRCSLESSKKAEASTLTLDDELADQIYSLLNRLNERYGFQEKIGIPHMTAFREIFRTEEESPDMERIWEAIYPALESSLESLDQMRQVEGENLYQGLKASLVPIQEVHQKLTDRAPLVIESYRERLLKRLGSLLPEDEVDQGRFMQEVALFSDRSDITEELDRLLSHIKQFYTIIDGPGPHGKRMDFLLQEMNREINTIGSKGNDLHISQWVVDSKCELEKMREQIQNIE